MKTTSALPPRTRSSASASAPSPAAAAARPRGYSADDVGPVGTRPASLVPAIAAGVTNNRGDELFKESPLTGVHVSSHGVLMPTPFHIYAADSTMLCGTADLVACREILAGTGLHPIEVGDGKCCAQLWVNDFKDTTGGPYREFGIIIPTRDQPSSLRWKNAYSALQPLLDSDGVTLFVHKLLLSEQPPIDYGREVLGFDKAAATIAIDTTRKGDKTFAASDAEGQSILMGKTRSAGFWSKLKGVFGIASVVGLKKTIKLVWAGLTGKILSGSFAVKDCMVKGPHKPIKVTPSYFKTSPAVRVLDANDTLVFNPRTEYGQLLTRMRFAPTIANRESNGRTVLGMPTTRPAAG